MWHASKYICVLPLSRSKQFSGMRDTEPKAGLHVSKSASHSKHTELRFIGKPPPVNAPLATHCRRGSLSADASSCVHVERGPDRAGFSRKETDPTRRCCSPAPAPRQRPLLSTALREERKDVGPGDRGGDHPRSLETTRAAGSAQEMQAAQ